MAFKRSEDYFLKLKKTSHHEFMKLYENLIHDYLYSIKKCNYCLEEGNDPSKLHHAKTRGLSMDLEKFGEVFRKRSLIIDKEK